MNQNSIEDIYNQRMKEIDPKLLNNRNHIKSQNYMSQLGQTTNLSAFLHNNDSIISKQSSFVEDNSLSIKNKLDDSSVELPPLPQNDDFDESESIFTNILEKPRNQIRKVEDMNTTKSRSINFKQNESVPFEEEKIPRNQNVLIKKTTKKVGQRKKTKINISSSNKGDSFHTEQDSHLKENKEAASP